jgi:uncharacterized membrane protein YwzB
MLFFLWPSDRGMLDIVVHLMFILVVKWWDADDHLIKEDAQGPPV